MKSTWLQEALIYIRLPIPLSPATAVMYFNYN